MKHVSLFVYSCLSICLYIFQFINFRHIFPNILQQSECLQNDNKPLTQINIKTTSMHRDILANGAHTDTIAGWLVLRIRTHPETLARIHTHTRTHALGLDVQHRRTHTQPHMNRNERTRWDDSWRRVSTFRTITHAHKQVRRMCQRLRSTLDRHEPFIVQLSVGFSILHGRSCSYIGTWVHTRKRSLPNFGVSFSYIKLYKQRESHVYTTWSRYAFPDVGSISENGRYNFYFRFYFSFQHQDYNVYVYMSNEFNPNCLLKIF